MSSYGTVGRGMAGYGGYSCRSLKSSGSFELRSDGVTHLFYIEERFVQEINGRQCLTQDGVLDRGKTREYRARGMWGLPAFEGVRYVLAPRTSEVSMFFETPEGPIRVEKNNRQILTQVLGRRKLTPARRLVRQD